MEIIIVFSFIIVIALYLYLLEPIFSRLKIKDTGEHGTAKFATFSEIKKNFSKEKISCIKESGFPVYFSKNYKLVWFDKQTPHWIVLGSTGSGKSVTSVIPQCSFVATAKKKKSVFVTDPKGEIFNSTSKMFRENGYDILTLDFRNPELSNHINLLETAIKEYESYDENRKLFLSENDEAKKMEYQNKSILHFAQCNQFVNDICSMNMEDATAKEKFWNNSASDLLYGLIFLFLEDYIDGKIRRDQITMSSIKKFQNSSMTDSNNRVLKKYIEKKSYGMKSKEKLLPLLNTSETTYRSITSTFNERMTIYDDVNVENIISNSDFEFDSLGKRPTALFFCIPDESKIYYSLVSIIVSLIYKTLVLLCNEQPNKRLPYDLVFMLDEFANTPPLSDITTMVSIARSRGMQFIFYIQSYAQLDNLYGKDVSQVIQDNAGLMYLKTNTQSTAEDISKRLGTHGVETSSVNYSMSFFNNNGNKNTSLMSRSLLTADEVKNLHYKTIIFPVIGNPIFRNTITYDKFSCYRKGAILRKVKPLKRLIDTYYTVEDINSRNREESVNDKSLTKKIEITNNAIKKRFEIIVNELLKIFNNVDYDVEYVNSDSKMSANLYLSSIMSNYDLLMINSLSDKMRFHFTVVSSKEQINKKNRNSKIEIYLN